MGHACYDPQSPPTTADDEIERAFVLAAAPDLLEALELMVSDLRQGVDPSDANARQRSPYSYDKARAAIAKARGEQTE